MSSAAVFEDSRLDLLDGSAILLDRALDDSFQLARVRDRLEPLRLDDRA